MEIKQKIVDMKKAVDKCLRTYNLKGIERIDDIFGYKLDDISERDIFMMELGKIQILNSLLDITDGLTNLEWKKKNKYKKSEV